jgi:hypothetical protein
MKGLLRVFLSFLTLGCVGIGWNAVCSAQPVAEPDLIVTAAPVYEPLAALEGKERFPQGAQLLRIHQGKAAPLIPGFYATADAQVSFKGDAVLFAARPTAADPWQIWEMPLNQGAPRKLFASPSDAIRPLYLPSGQFVFALRTAGGFQLEVAGKGTAEPMARIDDDAASTLLQLSHVPGNAIPADVLHDGRILFESVFPLGVGTKPEMYLVYSDGSGVESYRCDHGVARWGGHQLRSGDVLFTHGSSLARFTSSQAHELPVAAPQAVYAGGIVEAPSGAWLMSARAAGSKHFVLRSWKPGAPATALRTVLALADRDVVEPAVVVDRTRPNHHPTGLHPWNYANQLALDVRISRDGNLAQLPTQVRLETLDMQGRAVAAGSAPIEPDGSFFVQTPADRAIRFVLLDAKGGVVRREKGWFWIRAGEQRICVGCHAGPERSPENRVPEVLQKTTVPVNLTGVNAASTPQVETPGGN